MEKSRDAFRTISEVAEFLDTPAHVLRFWESRFPQVRPVKRAGGRRYYRPTDVALLSGIKRLLHSEGLTIRGVQKVLRDHGIRRVMAMADGVVDIDALMAAPSNPDATTALAGGAEVAGIAKALGDGTPPDSLGPAAAYVAPDDHPAPDGLPLWSASAQAALSGARDEAADETAARSDMARMPAIETHIVYGEDVPTLHDWIPTRLRALAADRTLEHHAALVEIAARLGHLRNRLADAARGGER